MVFAPAAAAALAASKMSPWPSAPKWWAPKPAGRRSKQVGLQSSAASSVCSIRTASWSCSTDAEPCAAAPQWKPSATIDGDLLQRKTSDLPHSRERAGDFGCRVLRGRGSRRQDHRGVPHGGRRVPDLGHDIGLGGRFAFEPAGPRAEIEAACAHHFLVVRIAWVLDPAAPGIKECEALHAFVPE